MQEGRGTGTRRQGKVTACRWLQEQGQEDKRQGLLDFVYRSRDKKTNVGGCLQAATGAETRRAHEQLEKQNYINNFIFIILKFK